VVFIGLGYVSNIVSGHYIKGKMATKFMGGALGKNATLTKTFYDSTHANYLIPYYIKVFSYIKKDNWTYTDNQAGLYLFGWNLNTIKDKTELF
jgi:hypothetical protein